MKDFKRYIFEKLRINQSDSDAKKTEDNLEDKIIMRKLVRVLTKFYNKDLTVCKDFQGDPDKESNWFYEFNPETLRVGTGNGYSAEKLVKYCKKIEEFKVIEKNNIPLVYDNTTIGNDRIWIRIVWSNGRRTQYGRGMKSLRLSKKFYEEGPYKKDQSKVAERGWRRWQGQSW